jgi:hypothetical protein
LILTMGKIDPLSQSNFRTTEPRPNALFPVLSNRGHDYARAAVIPYKDPNFSLT